MKRISQYQKLAKRLVSNLKKSANKQCKISTNDKEVLSFLRECASNTRAISIVRRALDCSEYRSIYRTSQTKDAKFVTYYLLDVQDETQAISDIALNTQDENQEENQ